MLLEQGTLLCPLWEVIYFSRNPIPDGICV